MFAGGSTHTDFIARLTGKTVSGTGRHGKWMWIELGAGHNALVHMGMTGNIRVKDKTPMKFMDFSVSAEWPPRFCKFILNAADGTCVAFSDARRLGRVRLSANPRAEPPISELGFDPYTSLIPLDEFILRARKRNVAIKALLLDQSFSSGVGNWIADEIFYQARIHPEERIASLSDDEMNRIYEAMRDIVKTACEAGADAEKFPQDWLFHTKWSKGTKDPRSRLGEKLAFVTVGGRTSTFAPERQKLKSKAAVKGAKVDEADDVKDEVVGKMGAKAGTGAGKAAGSKRGRGKKPEEAELEPESKPEKKRVKAEVVVKEEEAKPEVKAAKGKSVPATKPALSSSGRRSTRKV